MKIEPAYVTFEQSKLLKEKGFVVKVDSVYFPLNEPDKSFPEFDQNDWDNLQYSELPIHFPYEHFTHVSAPEQWQVIEWLELKHKKYIYAFRYNGIWQYKIDAEHGTDYFSTGKGYNSKQEAYSAAFDYVLSKMI